MATDGDVKQALFRLAHFDPTCTDEYGNQAIDYLVLDTLAAHGLVKTTASDIRAYLRNAFKLDFEEAEIDSSARRLCGKEQVLIEERGRFERPLLQIEPGTEQLVAEKCREMPELERDVLDRWKDELMEKYQQTPIISDHIDLIVETLQVFLEKMLRKHGVESAALLYPEDPKAKSWLADAEKIILGELPKVDPFIDAVIRLEIPLFLRNPDTKRRAYVSSLFNSSFMWHVLQIDETCSSLLKRVTKGQKLFLDCNILFSLVGFHGGEMLQAIHDTLSIAGRLGYERWVTTKTLDEFQASLRWQLQEARGRTPLPKTLARIALENLPEDSFISEYWREFVRTGMSLEEFAAEKSSIEDVLEGIGVQTSNKFRREIEDSDEFLREQSILRSVMTNEIHDAIIEHDAFHRIFIGKLRRGQKYRFSEAAAWFLTHDSKLPQYGRVARKGKDYLPFCITTDQWTQLNRPLLVRTASAAEYERSFHILVTQPFIRTLTSSQALGKTYTDVLGRLSRYKNMSEQLVLRLITDRHFMLTTMAESDQGNVEASIESKFVEVANSSMSQSSVLEQKLAKQEKELQLLSEKNAATDKLLKKTCSETQVIRDNLDVVREQQRNATHKIDELESHNEELTSQNTELASEAADAQTALKWVVFAFLLIVTSSAIWLSHRLISWNWMATHPNEILIKLAAEITAIFGLLCYADRDRLVIWIPAAIGFAIAALGLSARPL